MSPVEMATKLSLETVWNGSWEPLHETLARAGLSAAPHAERFKYILNAYMRSGMLDDESTIMVQHPNFASAINRLITTRTQPLDMRILREAVFGKYSLADIWASLNTGIFDELLTKAHRTHTTYVDKFKFIARQYLKEGLLEPESKRIVSGDSFTDLREDTFVDESGATIRIFPARTEPLDIKRLIPPSATANSYYFIERYTDDRMKAAILIPDPSISAATQREFGRQLIILGFYMESLLGNENLSVQSIILWAIDRDAIDIEEHWTEHDKMLWLGKVLRDTYAEIIQGYHNKGKTFKALNLTTLTSTAYALQFALTVDAEYQALSQQIPVNMSPFNPKLVLSYLLDRVDEMWLSAMDPWLACFWLGSLWLMLQVVPDAYLSNLLQQLITQYNCTATLGLQAGSKALTLDLPFLADVGGITQPSIEALVGEFTGDARSIMITRLLAAIRASDKPSATL